MIIIDINNKFIYTNIKINKYDKKKWEYENIHLSIH